MFTLRQLEVSVEGDRLNLLALPGTIDEPSEVEGAEDGGIATLVRLVKTLDGSTIGKGQCLPDVAIALLLHERLKRQTADVEEAFPEATFDIMDGFARLRGSINVGLQVLKFGFLRRTRSSPVR